MKERKSLLLIIHRAKASTRLSYSSCFTDDKLATRTAATVRSTSARGRIAAHDRTRSRL